MSEKVDKRKVLSESRLEHLKNMREKAALKRKQLALEKEDQAKQEVLSMDAEEVTEDELPPPPPQKTVLSKTVKPRKTVAIVKGPAEYVEEESSPYPRDAISAWPKPIQDEMYELVIENRKARKLKKWEARKAEIKQELFYELFPEEAQGAVHQDHHGWEPNGWALY